VRDGLTLTGWHGGLDAELLGLVVDADVVAFVLQPEEEGEGRDRDGTVEELNVVIRAVCRGAGLIRHALPVN
jgi:hypothetical protein